MSGYVRVYFHPEHGGVNLIDCTSFNISQSGDLVLYRDGLLTRAYAQGQWIFVTIVYPDDQGNK